MDGVWAHEYISHDDGGCELSWEVSGLNGKKTFGFASFGDLEDVLLWGELISGSVNNESDVGVRAEAGAVAGDLSDFVEEWGDEFACSDN